MTESTQDMPKADSPTAADAPTPTEAPTARVWEDKPPTVWDRVSFTCMRGLLRGVRGLFGWRGLYALTHAFGVSEYLVNYKRRRRIGVLLDTVFEGDIDPPARRHWIRQYFCRHRCDKVFYLLFDLVSTDRVTEHFSIVNRDILDAALERKHGVYFMLSHHGPHHITAMTMSALGYRTGAVRDPHEGAMRRFMQQMWNDKHPDFPRTKMMYSGSFVRDIYRLFKDNCIVGAALDVSRIRDPHQKTVPVRIYGDTHHFITGTLQIAMRCGATPIQVFLIAEPGFRYRLELLGPMLDPATAKETPEQLQATMQQYADNIAVYAKRHPDHLTRA